MDAVVLLRAVNVGGHQTFRPAALAAELAPLDVKSIGAAGTFVVRNVASAAAAKKAVRAALPFDTETIARAGADVLALVARAPLAHEEGRPFVSALAAAPRPAALPVEAKGVRIARVEDSFALSLVLPSAKPGADVNGLVERTLGVPATTRTWGTFEKIAAALEA